MADVILYTNNSETLLATSINTAALSIVGVDCSTFPSPVAGQVFYLTLSDDVQLPEIVKVTARTTNTLTVLRAQEGTTAKSWTATSTTISINITAFGLNQFAQGALNSGNAKGANAIDYQTARSVSTQVASGASSIAVGSNNTASGSTAIAIGISNTVSGTNSIGIGNTSTVVGSNSVGVGELTVASGNTATAEGYAATASNTNTTATGRSALASGANATAVGYNTDATNTDSTAVGSGAQSTTSGSTAVGKNANAGTNSDTTAVGSGSSATGFFATALGYSSLASGTRAIATGNATASGTDSYAAGEGATASSASSMAVGQSANASAIASIALGASSYMRRANSLNIMATRVLPPEQWYTGAEYGYNVASEDTIYSSYVDLTGGSTWATATLYNHGHVVKPTTPNGRQYWLWTSGITSITTAGAEPTWPTTHGDSVAAGSGAYWICVNAANYVVTIPSGVAFYPKEMGFLVEKYNTVTVQPSISFGESGNLTKYLAVTATTKLTALYAIEEYSTLASYVGGTSLAFQLQTAATGTQLLGRAFWTGKFIDVAV